MTTMTRPIALTASAFLALLAAGAALAQSSLSQEEAATARQAAVDKATATLLAAEKTRPRIGGYWRIAQHITTLTTAQGNPPPLNAAGRALYHLRAAAQKTRKKVGQNAGNKAGQKSDKGGDPMNACLPPGTPRVLLVDEPFLITQAAAKVTFYHQIHHVIRDVYLDGPLKLPPPDDRDVLWQGHSSGRWEGDVLVIESGDFNGKQWLDDSGLPQSPDMRVTERIRLIDASTLEDTITYDDAKYYSAPWTARLSFKAQPASTLLVEEDCAEKLLEVPLKEYAPGGRSSDE